MRAEKQTCFSGCQPAAAEAAVKLNGLDPEHYLRMVLERIADHPVSRIADLLPWNLATAQTQTS